MRYQNWGSASFFMTGCPTSSPILPGSGPPGLAFSMNSEMAASESALANFGVISPAVILANALCAWWSSLCWTAGF